MAQTSYPSLFQINTRILLRELSRKFRRTARLKDIPNFLLEETARQGFDWIWLLGIWQTGLVGEKVARKHPDLRPNLEKELPDLKEEDIVSSPFAIKRYVPNVDFGGPGSLSRIRERIHQRGMKLMLDFVPNHTAHDHVWVSVHPEYYVQGTEEDLARDSSTFIQLETFHGPKVFAMGKDPYFPSWTDTLQLNYRHRGLREAMIRTLLEIANHCEGLRCDMAMLVLPDVIQRTWGDKSHPADGSDPDDAPFWPAAIGRVRETHSDFVFMAEVYWDLEWELQQEGFDYTYDKRLYDRLREKSAEPVRQHLIADLEFQRKLVRFLENHDEPRAAATFEWDVHQAAAVISFLLPGMRFVYEGQMEGRKTHVSMQLARRPDEKPDASVRAFYEKLLTCVRRPEVRDGQWRQLDCAAGDAAESSFLAFLWEADDTQTLAVINYGAEARKCTVKVPREAWRGQQVTLRDGMGETEVTRPGEEMIDVGLTLELPPWGYHVYQVGDHVEAGHVPAEQAEVPVEESDVSETPASGVEDAEQTEI